MNSRVMFTASGSTRDSGDATASSMIVTEKQNSKRRKYCETGSFDCGDDVWGAGVVGGGVQGGGGVCEFERLAKCGGG